MQDIALYSGLVILIIEWFLGNTKLVKPNSLIELILTGIMKGLTGLRSLKK